MEIQEFNQLLLDYKDLVQDYCNKTKEENSRKYMIIDEWAYHKLPLLLTDAKNTISNLPNHTIKDINEVLKISLKEARENEDITLSWIYDIEAIIKQDLKLDQM